MRESVYFFMICRNDIPLYDNSVADRIEYE